MLSPINWLARTISLTHTFTPTFSFFHPPIAYHKIPSNACWFIADHTDLLWIRPLRNRGTVLIYFPCQLTRRLIQYDRLPGTREEFYGRMRVQRSQITSIQPRGIIFPISSAYNLVCSALLLQCDLYTEHCATYAPCGAVLCDCPAVCQRCHSLYITYPLLKFGVNDVSGLWGNFPNVLQTRNR